ncbi:MAG: hypothetical protein JWO80_4287 [Bryobacterales bacterium]|nr:hypothetical protein [Bryobacterales bacterium]
MRTVNRIAVLLCICSGPILAHDPVTTRITWTQEISRIVQNRCLRCHGEGSSISFATYAEARPWAKAIRNQVLTRKMPPWGAVHGAGEFRDDPSLTEPEIERVVQWVEGGAPEGDPIYLPRPRSVPAVAAIRRHEAARISSTQPLTLKREYAFTAIRPDSPLEAVATLPDGRVEHLIWLKDYHGLTYVFRDPVRLPKGTVVRVTRGSAVLLDLAPVASVALH